MQQAEHAAAEDILNEALRYLPNAETFQRQGRPEREIVNIAAEWQADLVIICPRAEYGGKPAIGPRSVGHVARFVLDHAPCPVLLVRPLTREQFPGSVADRCIPHAASMLCHTWKGSAPKFPGRSDLKYPMVSIMR